MEHLIASHRSRPSDDPIFALNAEAKARKAAGESVVNATVGVLLDDSGALALLPSVSEALREHLLPLHEQLGDLRRDIRRHGHTRRAPHQRLHPPAGFLAEHGRL